MTALKKFNYFNAKRVIHASAKLSTSVVNSPFLIKYLNYFISERFNLSLLVDVFKSFHFVVFTLGTGRTHTHRIQKYPYSFAYGNSLVFIA